MTTPKERTVNREAIRSVAVLSAQRTSQPHATAPAAGAPQRVRRVPWLLLAVLTAQAALSLRLIWSTSAFEDEAQYLWAGHAEIGSWLHGSPVPSSISWFASNFSGAPVLYPPLGAMADSLGGLAGARLLSLAFMLAATVLLWSATTRLFSRTAGTGAAAAFVLLGSTQFLGAFATFDAMALFLLALAAWLVIRAPANELLLIAAGLVLALADATKYAAALWDPVVIGLAVLLVTEREGPRRAVGRGVRLLAYTAVPFLAALYGLGGQTYITGIMSTTLKRNVFIAGTSAPASAVLHSSLTWLWPMLILAAAAVVVSIAGSPVRTLLICCLMAVALVLAPLHQAQIQTAISLNKHVDFGAWFGAIAAGYVLARAATFCRARWWRIVPAAAAGAAAVCFAAYSGITQAHLMFGGWPDMSRVVAEEKALLPAHHCPCLMMSSEIMQYYLETTMPVSQEQAVIATPYFLQYLNSRTHREVTSSAPAAYETAIRQHYFGIVENDSYDDAPLSVSVAETLAATPGYRLVSTVPWGGVFGNTETQIWVHEKVVTGRHHKGK
jgi:4-amino-4-deoxy-L-arabinose transferase-like glycosyltransferase